MRRVVGASLVSVLGTALVFGLVLGMNAGATRPESERGPAVASFDLPPPPPPKPKKQRPEPRKVRQAPAAKAPPAPLVGAGLAGLSFGLDGLLGAGLGGDGDGLLGEVADVVMTESSVDEPPRPVQQVAPAYPERARKKGVTGGVSLSLLIGVDGAVRDARVLESAPAGVFDEAALAAVRQWRFTPAQYEGRPVAIRVTLPLSFGFDG